MLHVASEGDGPATGVPGNGDKSNQVKDHKIPQPDTALILEDDDFDAAITQELLENCCDKKFSAKRARALKGAVNLLSRTDFCVALVDMDVPDSQGLETVREILMANPNVPVVVLTGYDDIDTAVAALELGAQDYLPKSQLDNRMLQRVIEYSILRKAKEDALTSKAHFDGLTGLANRTLLYERWRRSLARSMRGGFRTGLMIADVDQFKLVNDSSGHHAGDHVLKDFAETLISCVRETDVVARLGGDEFIVVLENIKHKRDLDAVRDKIMERMPLSTQYENQKIRYSASIGTALSDPRDDEDLMSVIRRADQEMYECKALAHKKAESIAGRTKILPASRPIQLSG